MRAALIVARSEGPQPALQLQKARTAPSIGSCRGRSHHITTGNLLMLSAAILSLGVVALAEMGDKSQLVCMLLASRYRAWPVLLGAVTAFFILNALAVTVGASLASLLPMAWILSVAALLFFVFGIQSLLAKPEDGGPEIQIKSSKSVLFTAFLMIFVSELGDKTQLSVAAMSLSHDALGVWLGASLALLITSVLGVWAGQSVLARINPVWLHRVSGVIFLLMAGLTGSRLLV